MTARRGKCFPKKELKIDPDAMVGVRDYLSTRASEGIQGLLILLAQMFCSWVGRCGHFRSLVKVLCGLGPLQCVLLRHKGLQPAMSSCNMFISVSQATTVKQSLCYEVAYSSVSVYPPWP